MPESTSPRAVGNSPQFICRPASRSDLPATGRVYIRAFPDSLRDLHSPNLKPEAVADLLAAVQAVDPGSIIVAEVPDGGVVGYIIAPSDVAAVSRAVWRQVLRFTWLGRWVSGRYGLSGRGLLGLLLDRVHLWRSGAAPDYPARVLSVAVDPEWQSKGIGKALVQAALRRFVELGITAVRLEVRPANTAARRLYASLGFAPVGEVRDSRGPWVVMIADISRQRADDAP